MGAGEIVLGEDLQTGVEALAEKHGQAEVIAQGNDQPYVFVDIGGFDIRGFGFDQEVDEARVILRVHKDFPQGQHYGVVTIPVLTVDGDDPDNTTRNHPHAECLRDFGITEDYLYWSRDWQELSMSEPEDMAKAVAFVRGTLRNPFND